MTFTSAAYLTCLCGAVSVPGTLLSDAEFPIHEEICHCNSCRHTTGSLGAAFPSINAYPPDDALSQLTAYTSSKTLTRYFCSTCGSYCFVHNHGSKSSWCCLSGIIELDSGADSIRAILPEDIIKITCHAYVLDTIDGGLSPLLLNLDGRSIPTWSAAANHSPNHNSSDLPHASVLSLPTRSTSTLLPPGDESYLTAKCHCKGVSLLIKRASYPFRSNSSSESSARYIPSDPTKYLTYFCACRSCRLSTGVSMQAWALIPPANVFNANTPSNTNDVSSPTSSQESLVPVEVGHSTSSPNANPGLTLKHHWSTSDVCRSFCGICGATISYWNAQRPAELDLAVGILRSEEGCMARRWLEWEWGRCSFAEESVDGEVCKAWLGCAEIMTKVGG